MGPLPCEMIEEILYRVPVKHLLRFRCVSKGWCSRIDSNDFAKKHLKTSLELNSGVGLLIKDDVLTSLDSWESLELDGPFKRLISTSQLVGASNGLMCAFHSHYFGGGDFFVLNPITRKFRKVPPVSPEFSKFEGVFLGGFGYDAVNDDFKIVKFEESEAQFGVSFIVMVYSLKTNVWARVHDVPSNFKFYPTNPYNGTMSGAGVFASGSLHWIANEDQKDVIVAFDCTLEQFNKVPFPPTRYESRLLLGNLGQYLSIENTSGSLVDVWVMKYCGAERTWYKAHSRTMHLCKQRHKMYSSRYVAFSKSGDVLTSRYLAFSKSGEDVLLEEQNRYRTTCLVWYSLDPAESEDSISTVGIRRREFPKRFCSCVYTESLLHLPKDEDAGFCPCIDTEILLPLSEDEDEDEDEQLQSKPSIDKQKKNQEKNKRDDLLSTGFNLRL